MDKNEKSNGSPGKIGKLLKEFLDKNKKIGTKYHNKNYSVDLVSKTTPNLSEEKHNTTSSNVHGEKKSFEKFFYNKKIKDDNTYLKYLQNK